MIEGNILQALFSSSTEGIIIVEENGKIFEVNPSALSMFGYAKNELIGNRIEMLVPMEKRDKHSNMRSDYNTHPNPRKMGGTLELMALKKNNIQFPVEISLSPCKFGDINYVIAFVIDITERKKIEQKLKQYSSDLEQQVKDRTLILTEAIEQLEQTKEELKESLAKERELNDMKSRFVTMASHEFRTPLATILSSLSLVGKYTDLGEEEKRIKHMERIKSAVNNMTDILNDFLSLSKLEEGKTPYSPSKFNVLELFNETVQEMRGVVKRGQTIAFKHKCDFENVFLDEKILKNILLNLLSNAIKFSSEGKEIEVYLLCDKNGVSFHVKDKGIGISENDKKHLFERFFRGENATNIQGTGLGLNIIEKYIELLNGTIQLESELNIGSTFTITISKPNPI